MTRTIKDVEEQIAQDPVILDRLQKIGLFGKGWRLRLRLLGPDRAKRRDADFEKNWQQDKDSLSIKFEPAADSLEPSRPKEASGKEAVGDSTAELLCALDHVEARGLEFIALKWFRDTALPGEGFSWATDESARQRVLSDAIERRLVVTHKVPNPKAPQFPVTAIRLNRLKPEVRSALGLSERETAKHRPITMRGEALSETVLRDRR